MEKRFPPGAEVWNSEREQFGIVIRHNLQVRMIRGLSIYGDDSVCVRFPNNVEAFYTKRQAEDLLEVAPLKRFDNNRAERKDRLFDNKHFFCLGDKVRRIDGTPGTVWRVLEDCGGIITITIHFTNGDYIKYSHAEALIKLRERGSSHLSLVRK